MVTITEQDLKAMAEALVAETKAAGGLAPVDLAAFWAAQDEAVKDPFNSEQVALSALWSSECIFDELGIKEDWYRYYHDQAWVLEQSARYNDLAENIVGRRLLNEVLPDVSKQWPQSRQLHELFEGKNVFHNDSFWLQQAADNEEELAALLDRVEERLLDPAAFFLGSDWDERCAAAQATGAKPNVYRHQRGPVTLATSIYGVENLCYLYYDDPDLMKRYADCIVGGMLALRMVTEESCLKYGGEVWAGFSLADDNCFLLTPEQYDFFAAPVLQAMFDHCAPKAGDWRYQHSDSAMGHLLPILARLNLSQVNFGPTVPAALIRQHMPNTIIQGQLAPFTYSRNDEVGMVYEFLRDMAQLRASRGLLFGSAGSVNNGSRLTGLRLIMAAVQRWGQY